MNREEELSKRITLKRVRPNPLFESWLEELYEEAKENKSKLEPMLKEALDSLSKYPLPLQSGAECIILKGFKKGLCEHIDKRIEIYRYNLALEQSSAQSTTSGSSGVDSPISDVISIGTTLQPQNSNVIHPETPKKNNVASNSELNTALDTSLNDVAKIEKKSESTTKKKAKYMPAFRSGPYAIIRALLEHQNDSNDSLSKEELIAKAQQYSDESFTRPKTDTYYTAWSNMTRLVTKGLVKKIGTKPAEYQLSSEGIQLARDMMKEYQYKLTDNDIIFNDAQPSSSKEERGNNIVEDVPMVSSQTDDDMNIIEFLPSTFDIILLIDKNETGGLSKKNDPTVAQFNKYYDLKHEYRNLKVGDFTWIARHQIHKDQELVLPYIVERKRMDDLGASIKDGRFHEQKFRLRKCGIPNVIYLVEDHGNNKNVGLPMQNLQQAMANTRIQDGFKVHMTDSLRNSARFLAMMTKRLTIRYKDKTVKGRNAEADNDYFMTFEYFNKASIKTKVLTVTETFIKLLLQLKGVSVEKALAITAKYSTPKSLIIAYQKCDRSKGECLLASLKYGDLGRNVGPAVSKAIYQLFSYIGEE